MQLGFVTAILPDLTLEQILEHAARIGYDCVEVMCWPLGKAERRYAGVTHLDVADLSPSKAEAVRELCRKHRVAISGLGYYPNPLAPNEAEAQVAVEQLRKIIQAAPLLELSQVNTFIGRDWTKSVEDNWARMFATWKPLVRLAEENGVRIGIENCPMLFTADEWPGGKNLATTPAIWRRLFADLDSTHIGLNYDPSHMVWLQMDYLKPLREFKDRLFHLHAKDVRIERDKLDEHGVMSHPNLWHVPKLPGLGEVDWGRFVSILGDTGYTGPVCVEVEDRAYEKTLELRLAALQQSHDYLRNFIPRRHA